MNLLPFERYLRELGKSPGTIRTYSFDVQQFVERNPGYMTYGYPEISRYFASLNERYQRNDGKVTATVSKMLTSLRWLYTFLVVTGVREEHPFPPSYRIRGTKKRGFDSSNILTPRELDDLLSYAKEEPLRYGVLRYRNMAVLSLLIYQALTCEELVQLSLHDLDLDTGMVEVKATRSTCGRVLSLHPSQFMVLHSYLSESRPKLLSLRPEDAHIYPRLIVGTRGMGETVSGIGCFIRRYRGLFPGKELSATTIRKSVIYNWLNEDRYPVHDVQYWAGHAWPSTTKGYVSPIAQDDPSVINGWHPMERL